MRGGMQKDLPPAKQPHVLSSSQRWNFTDLLVSKVPKNLDLFSKKKTSSKRQAQATVANIFSESKVVRLPRCDPSPIAYLLGNAILCH